MEELASVEQLHATAAHYLLDGGEFQVGELLILSSLSCAPSGESWMNGSYLTSGALLTLVGPRLACDAINDYSSDVNQKIRDAFAAALGPFRFVSSLVGALERITPTPGWKEEMAERLRGQQTNNQAKDHSSEPPQRWQGLGFRSVTEVVVAKALDDADVLFLSLCATRVTLEGEQRGTFFPDFLVCQRGKWGILEVDGEPWHPPGTAAKGHRRDRYF